MARKMKNVVCTAPADRLDMAALTGNKSWMAQGCRPTSDTTQPAWLATKAKGMLHRAIRCSHLCPYSLFSMTGKGPRRKKQ